ncbi:MAG: GNAT family N-acetyltransferase [Oligoflexia bacterium]|nr:GNAT family N-acetyltransferase [Oligoflexia bacterium]
MSIELRPFDPNPKSKTFSDSIKLMQSCFSDPSANSTEFLDWLGNKNPYKKAIGYLAYDNEIPVSQSLVFFQQLLIDNKARTVGIICNVCTEKNYRGKGIFYQILNQILIDSKKIEIPFLIAYPNQLSVGGFTKAGFLVPSSNTFELSFANHYSFSRELLLKKKTTKKDIPEDLNPPKEGFPGFELISEIENPIYFKGKYSTPLDNVQLKWRYLDCPTRKYYPLKHLATNEIVIIRIFSLFGFKTAAIMKQTTMDPTKWRLIIKSLKKSLKKTCSIILNLANVERNSTDIFHNRIYIPSRFSPRKFPLVVYPIEKIKIDEKSFLFSFGDYETL